MTTTREAIDQPGGILHWRRYFAFLASSGGAELLSRLGVVVPPGAVSGVAEELAAATDALMADPRSKEVEFFVEHSTEVLDAAFARLAETCGPDVRDVVLEYGMVDPGQTAHSFLWGILFERLLRGEGELADKLSAPVLEVLHRWRDARRLGTDDDELVEYVSVQQAWDAIRAVAPPDEVEAVLAWARTEAADLGLEGTLEPLGAGRHPKPFVQGDD